MLQPNPKGNPPPACSSVAVSQSEWQVWLWMSDDAASGGQPSVPSAHRPESTGPGHHGAVLIVEDDPDARDTLADLLQLYGYAVATANNGREALEYLAFSPAPCLILLDLMMPVMDGWEFLRQQQHESRFAAIPVVVLSGVVGARHTVHSEAAVGYLPKPLDLRSLTDLLERHC